MIESPPREVTTFAENEASYSLWQLILYFLRLGSLGFGGPVALVGYMYRDLVEQRGWITEADYKVGMALAQLAPGPLAAQLGIYMGFVHYRILGATLVGIAFVLPSFLNRPALHHRCTDHAARAGDGGAAVEVQETARAGHRIGRRHHRPSALSDAVLALALGHSHKRHSGHGLLHAGWRGARVIKPESRHGI